MAIKCPKCHSENTDKTRYCKNCAAPLHPIEETSIYETERLHKPRKKLTIGSIVIKKFQVIEELGGGRMGIVYKAKDTKLKRTVALKFLPSDLTRDEKYKMRFIQEAQAASILDHQNICTIFEIDETDDGTMFIAMAFYKGETLKKKIEQAPFPVEKAIDTTIQVAQGLVKAHSEGIVHRDLKPANIMITDEGIVKILDFGLAKLSGQTRITRTDTILGTVAYMSPEQAQGESVNHRADIWSLGVVLFEILAGQLPFKGENEQAYIYSILNKSPTPLTELRSDIPDELERIVFKCLRKEQKDRYKSAQHLLTNLTRLKEILEKEKDEATAAKKEKKDVSVEPERRLATVMFVEISGYIEMLERMDTEEVATVMTRCFEMFGSIEEKYGGWINKITENSLIVLFGVPAAIEGAPKKAINAAIELRNKLDRFNQKENLQIPLDIHIGINTGMVIASTMRADDKKGFTVVGDAVNLASQLKDLSAKGEIHVGHLTYRYTREEFEYKPQKPIALKGKKESFSVFELLSVKEKIYRAGLGSDRMIYSEMVGRDKEFDKLLLHVLKVINGEGSIINIIGEAGIGKSRLIAELKRKDEMKKVNFLKGRALSIGKNLSFHPIIDIIKNWAGIKENDSSSETIHKLEKAIRSIYPEGTDEVFPFTATLMGMKLVGKHAERIKGIEGEALEVLILKSLRELLRTAATQKPLVIVLEDLHWADLTSIEFLESLYRLAENNPILFINVFRPDHKNTGEKILKTVRSRYNDFYSEIILESLDKKQSEALINNLLKIKERETNINELIVKKAGGNPFFIEEVVRSFIDGGVVEFKDGYFRITEKIDSVIVPETINEVLMERIDKLDEDTKSLLKVASVIGRNFFYKILADVAKTIEEIDDRLEYLKETQLILERRRMAELEYLFKHALAQEVTYESILVKKRKKLHLKIANSIELVFADRLHEFYGMLALHYSKGEDLDKAEEYLIKAGEEALKSSASSEALHYYQEAMNIYLKKYGDAADPGKIAMLEKNIALALFNRGQYIEADEYFSKVLSYYGEKLPKHPISVLLKFSLGLLSFLMRIYFPFLKKDKIPARKDSEIMNLFYKKNTSLIFLDPERMFMEIFYWLWKLINFDLSRVENGVGIISMSSAAFSYGGISFRFSRKILEFIKDKVDWNDVKSVLYFKVPEVLLNTFSGDWENIGEYDDNLVEQNVRIGELFYASGYVLTHGYSKIARGNFNTSLKLAQRLYEIADIYENDYSRAAYYWFKTQVLLKFRKLNDVLQVSEEGIDFTNKTGFRPYMFSLYSFKARVQVMLGDIKEAENSLQYLNKIKSEINLVPYFLTTFYLSQLIFDLQKLERSITEGKRTESASCRKRALKTAKQAIKNSQKIAADITESYKLMGIYYWLLGKQKRALKWWEKSVKEGERLGARLELSRTFMEVGKRLSDIKSKYKELNGLNGQQYLEKARALFKEMDLQWDLENMEQRGAQS